LRGKDGTCDEESPNRTVHAYAQASIVSNVILTHGMLEWTG